MEVDQSENISIEQSDLEEEAALEAGFTGVDQDSGSVDGDTASAPEGATEDTTENNEQDGIEQDQDGGGVEVELPLTRAELKALEQQAAQRIADLESKLNKVHDKAFGKLGELQQRISAVRGLSPKAREKLNELDSELAEILFGDSDATDAAPAAQQPDGIVHTDLLEQARLEREEDRRNFQRQLLSRDHKDWTEIVQDQSFLKWTGSLPVDEQTALQSSWDADFVSSKISEFKAWRTAEEEKAKKKELGKKRLAAAVMPKGNSLKPEYNIEDEESAMESGFKQVRGK